MNYGKTRIRKTLFIIYLAAVGTAFVFGILPFWLRPEARYARDNLEYLTTRLSEYGIMDKISTHGLRAVRYPYPVAVSEICNLTEAWTEGYLSVVAVGGITDEYCLKLGLNPYDTLSGLVFDCSDKDVERAYFATMMLAAFVNPDNNMESFDYTLARQAVISAREESAQACYDMNMKMLYHGVIYFILIIPLIFDSIRSALLYHRRKEGIKKQRRIKDTALHV